MNTDCHHEDIELQEEYNFDVTVNGKNEKIRRTSPKHSFIGNIQNGLITTFLLSVDIHEGNTDVEHKLNCKYEQRKEKNAILLRKTCNELTGGLLPTHIDVQERTELSYTEIGRDFERTEIIRWTVTELTLLSLTRSKLITTKNNLPPPDVEQEQGQWSGYLVFFFNF